MRPPRLALAAAALVPLALASVLALPAAAAPRTLVFPSNPTGGNTATGFADGPRCAPLTSRSLRGVVLGSDGRAVNATIGFDVLDSARRKIDVGTGCPSGGAYGAIVQLNHWVGAQGAAVGSRMVDDRGRDRGVVDGHFAVLRLPANAAHVYIEVWTRGYVGGACGLSCAGPVDTSRYGFVNRRELVPGPATTSLHLTAPLRSQTGDILLTLNRPATEVLAFSQIPDGSMRLQGWGVGVPVPGSGGRAFRVPALAAGQPYVVQVDGGPITRDVAVRARATTRLAMRF